MASVVVVTTERGVWDLSTDMQTVSVISTCRSVPALHQLRELEACVT